MLSKWKSTFLRFVSSEMKLLKHAVADLATVSSPSLFYGTTVLLCVHVCHNNEPLKKIEKKSHKNRDTSTHNYGTWPSCPAKSFPHSPHLKQRGHKCETELIKQGKRNKQEVSKVIRRLTLHSPAQWEWIVRRADVAREGEATQEKINCFKNLQYVPHMKYGYFKI